MPGAPEDFPFPDGPVSVPICSELDLHTFRPDEIGNLIPEWLEACRERGILKVRIIHGKGTGRLRAGVEALLRRLPEVESFSQAAPEEGHWGATTVRLKPK